MTKTERSIGERWYEIEDRRMTEAFEEAAARYKAKDSDWVAKREDGTTLVLVDSDPGRVWVPGDGVSWFRDGPDAAFTSERGKFPMPEDLSENFAAISGKEAERLAREAAEVKA